MKKEKRNFQMRTNLLLAGVVALFLATAVSAASAQTRSFWDRNGSFAGSSVTRDNSTSFTDRNGRFDGSAIRNSNGTTSFYDRNGHFTGSTTTQPAPAPKR
jgi:hypothetical protein